MRLPSELPANAKLFLCERVNTRPRKSFSSHSSPADRSDDREDDVSLDLLTEENAFKILKFRI